MNRTGIEWCSMTWNVLRGCSPASAGCDHCYAETLAKRFIKPGQPFEHVINHHTGRWNGMIQFFEHKLNEPFKVKTPQLVFANSMSDICHPDVQPRWVDRILEAMRFAPWHYYLCLTKRPNWIARKFFVDLEPRRTTLPAEIIPRMAMGTSIESMETLWRGRRLIEQWPGLCFLSLEPLLERVSIEALLQEDLQGQIRQVIVGGETGAGARPMRPDWVRQLRDEAKDAGCDFFFKQWGTGHFPAEHLKVLGRMVDAREWNESPWPVPLPAYEGELARHADVVAALEAFDYII